MNSARLLWTMLLLALLLPGAASAQAPAGPRGKVTGKLLAADTGEPLGFADVALIPVGVAAPKPIGTMTNADGTFTLERLDRTQYTIVAAAEDRAPAEQRHVAGGARDVTLVLDPGLPLAGVVVTPEGEPVPSYTLLVERRTGLVRQTVVERSIVAGKNRKQLHRQHCPLTDERFDHGFVRDGRTRHPVEIGDLSVDRLLPIPIERRVGDDQPEIPADVEKPYGPHTRQACEPPSQYRPAIGRD